MERRANAVKRWFLAKLALWKIYWKFGPFRLYVNLIPSRDEDPDMYFQYPARRAATLVLTGGYLEEYAPGKYRDRGPWSLKSYRQEDRQRVEAIASSEPTWVLFLLCGQLKEEPSPVLSVARDFSLMPFGRIEEDGPHCGEALCDLMAERLSQRSKLVVDLDGTIGYGSSFLHEAFGGLVTRYGYTREGLRENLTLISRDSSLKMEIWQYIDNAPSPHLASLWKDH